MSTTLRTIEAPAPTSTKNNTKTSLAIILVDEEFWVIAKIQASGFQVPPTLGQWSSVRVAKISNFFEDAS
jgi:hypothetical protein